MGHQPALGKTGTLCICSQSKARSVAPPHRRQWSLEQSLEQSLSARQNRGITKVCPRQPSPETPANRSHLFSPTLLNIAPSPSPRSAEAVLCVLFGPTLLSLFPRLAFCLVRSRSSAVVLARVEKEIALVTTCTDCAIETTNILRLALPRSYIDLPPVDGPATGPYKKHHRLCRDKLRWLPRTLRSPSGITSRCRTSLPQLVVHTWQLQRSE